MESNSILSVRIGDKTYNVQDIKPICNNKTSIRINFDIECIEKYVKDQKEKLFKNSKIHFAFYDDYGFLHILDKL